MPVSLPLELRVTCCTPSVTKRRTVCLCSREMICVSVWRRMISHSTQEQRTTTECVYESHERESATVMGWLMKDSSSAEGMKKCSISAMMRVLANSLMNCGLLTVTNSRLNSTPQSQAAISCRHCFYPSHKPAAPTLMSRSKAVKCCLLWKSELSVRLSMS